MDSNPIWFIRNAKSRFNHALYLCGMEEMKDPEFVDALLSEEGLAQIEEKRGIINMLTIEHIYVSPYRRALQTWRELFGHRQIPVTVCPLIAEHTKFTCDASVHEGKPIEGFEHFDWSMVGDEPFILKQLPADVVEELDREDLVASQIKVILERSEPIEPEESLKERCQKFRELIAGRKNIAIVSHKAFIFAYTGVNIENVDVLRIDNSQQMSSNPVFLIRHAESAFNVDWGIVPDIAYSPKYVDPLLTERGRQQAQDTIWRADALQVEEVFVSPLRRTLETCQILFGHREGLKITVCPLIIEKISLSGDFSSYNGAPLPGYEHFDWSQMPSSNFQIPYVQETYREQLTEDGFLEQALDFAKQRVELETFEQVHDRVNAFREQIRGRKNIAVVTHQCFIKAYHGKDVDNCAIVEIDNT